MKRLVTPFFMAWGMFCAIPCPYPHWDNDQKPAMLAAFPLLGLMLGALWALAAFVLTRMNAPILIAAALLTALPYLLTGFIHLDGYMDCCDAILSRRDLATRQRILKDSHVGSFAVICLGILLLLGFAVCASCDFSGRRCLVLPFLSCAARCPSALAVMILPPMETSGYSRTQSGVRPVHRALVLLTLAAAVLLPLLLGRCGFAVLAAPLGAAPAILRGRKQLGGMNGDISGMAVTIGEVCGLAALALL